MNGCVIPHTPIAVDLWKIRECPYVRLFFLSHLHGDHIVGLTSSWHYPIYCTPITAKILKLRHDIKESLVHPLDLGVGHILYLDEEKLELITVTLLEANHCPGACMFLFQGYFGNILYTGDFRYDKRVTESSPLCDIAGNLDIIYLDNTYCLPACSFPSRQECLDQILGIIRKFPDYHVVIGLRSLGKEDLLVKIALELEEWIAITPKMFELVNILNLPQIFKTDPSQCRIRVEPFHIISNRNINAWNEKSPTIVILPTALYYGLNMSPFINQDKVFIVPYSDHSSYTELLSFVSYLRPSSIRPIVRASSRGPFGTSIASRADMTCFNKYLNKNRAVQKSSRPESVRTLMFSHSLGSLPRGKGGVKRRKSVKFSKSKIKKRGVIFEDSPDKSNMNETMREHSVGNESTPPDMVEKTFECDSSCKIKPIASVQRLAVNIESTPQNKLNLASVTFKIARYTQESSQICNGDQVNESDPKIVFHSGEGVDPHKTEGVTSLPQSVDTEIYVNYNSSQQNLKEDNSNRTLCADNNAFQPPVDLTCESHDSPELSNASWRPSDLYKTLNSDNENLEATDIDDETNQQFKNRFLDVSNYSCSSDSCDVIRDDSSSQVGQSEPPLIRQPRISIQSASESRKPKFSDYEVLDQVSSSQSPESQNQPDSKDSGYLTCWVKNLTPKILSEKINTKDLKSSTMDTKGVNFLNSKNTERMNLSNLNHESDLHGNRHDYHGMDLQKQSNSMAKSSNDISDIHSGSPNDINNKFQDLNSNNPNNHDVSKAVDFPCELLKDESQILTDHDQCESLGFEYNVNLTQPQLSVPLDHYYHSQGFEYDFKANISDSREEIQFAGITVESVEHGSNKATYVSKAGFTNKKSSHCSNTQNRCSQIETIDTTFQTRGLKMSDTSHSQHKQAEIDLPFSLYSKEKTQTFKEPDLGLPLYEESLHPNSNGRSDDVDTDIVIYTSEENTGVIVQKVIENQVAIHSTPDFKIDQKSTVLCHLSSCEEGNQSSASSTNNMNLRITSSASFCTKGEACRNIANSEKIVQVMEESMVKGDNLGKEHCMQRMKFLDLDTKEIPKDCDQIVFTNVSVKPLNKDIQISRRGRFYRNFNEFLAS